MHKGVHFSCSSQKKVVSLPSKVQRRGLEGGRCPLSESQMLTQRPQSRLSRHIKKAFIALCSGWQKSRKFLPDKNLATIDVLRDIDYPSCAYFGTPFAYMHMRTRVP